MSLNLVSYYVDGIINLCTSNKYKVREYILDNKLDKKVNKIRLVQYIKSICNFDIDDNYYNINDFINMYGINLFESADKINKNRYKRSSRLKRRVEKMFSLGRCLFLTFTFNDIVMNKTTYDIRRRYVRDLLYSLSEYYIANIDFGENTGREHYHAIILLDYFDKNLWKYGYSFIKVCNIDRNSIESLSYYVNKMSNHAIKRTTGNNYKLIYSRKVSKL